MAKSKITPVKTGAPTKGNGPTPLPQLFLTPHAAVLCKGISFTPLGGSLSEYSVGLVFRKNTTGAAFPVFDIQEVFYRPADLKFVLGPLMAVDQVVQQFSVKNNPSGEDFILQNNPSRNFSHLEFTNGITASKPWHFGFFARNELEPMLAISPDVVVSGTVLKFGKVAWQHPSSWVHPGEEYFSLKAEVVADVVLPGGQSSAKSGGSSDEIPLPLVTTAQPCPPRWDTFGVVLASLSVSQEVFRDIVSDGEKIKKVLVAWLQMAERLEAKP